MIFYFVRTIPYIDLIKLKKRETEKGKKRTRRNIRMLPFSMLENRYSGYVRERYTDRNIVVIRYFSEIPPLPNST